METYHELEAQAKNHGSIKADLVAEAALLGLCDDDASRSAEATTLLQAMQFARAHVPWFSAVGRCHSLLCKLTFMPTCQKQRLHPQKQKGFESSLRNSPASSLEELVKAFVLPIHVQAGISHRRNFKNEMSQEMSLRNLLLAETLRRCKEHMPQVPRLLQLPSRERVPTHLPQLYHVDQSLPSSPHQDAMRIQRRTATIKCADQPEQT